VCFGEIKNVALSACLQPSSIPFLQPLISVFVFCPIYRNDKGLSYDREKKKNLWQGVGKFAH